MLSTANNGVRKQRQYIVFQRYLLILLRWDYCLGHFSPVKKYAVCIYLCEINISCLFEATNTTCVIYIDIFLLALIDSITIKETRYPRNNLFLSI